MATSQRTFQQVKNILGTLDRRIDALREQRLTPPAPPAAAGQGPGAMSPNTLIGAGQTGALAPSGIPAPAKPAQPAPAGNPPRSIYGRATPLRHVS